MLDRQTNQAVIEAPVPQPKQKKRRGNLALSRRNNEQVVIYSPDCEPIIVTIVRVCNGKVRLTVNAEDDVRVLRGELAAA